MTTSLTANEDIYTLPILYVDDEQSNLDNFLLGFEDQFTIFAVDSAIKALEIMEKQDIGLIITDERMPKMTGIEFLEKVVKKWPETIRIIISAYNDAEILLRAMNNGHAHEYILKPWVVKELKKTIISSLLMVKKRRLLAEKAQLTDVLQSDMRFEQSPDTVIGEETGLKDVVETARRIAPMDVPVLITGETGTGKEVISHLIHESSGRIDRPYIRVNCPALPESTLESELFGHEKGAFTGAASLRKGRFELANKGTIFLDEIGDISPKLQLMLLRVLQEGEFERVGGVLTLKTNARVITATNRNLEQLVKEGKFRSDLYFRLNVVPIEIPALKDRIEDVELLFMFFLDKYSKKFNIKNPIVDKEVIYLLKRYDWPGNVRELENMVQRALVTARSGYIKPESFSFTLGTLKAEEPVKTPTSKGPERNSIREAEKIKIRDALKQAVWNVSKAAKIAGMPRSTFKYKAKKYNLI